MMMKEFCEDLNSSPWKGAISEVGIGLQFSAGYLKYPGASKTILKVTCDYAGKSVVPGVRAVSLENARREAKDNWILSLPDNGTDDSSHRFGLAITAAHYEDRPSHGWVYIATDKWDACMHFSIDTSPNRGWVAERMSERVQWFMNACMLSNESWVTHIADIGDSLETHNIDVLYGPGLSDVERLLLLRPGNPLTYVDGKFQRVVDVVRKYGNIYAGAFNPPTRRHLSVDDCLFEISQRHHYKGGVHLESLLHRMRMFSAARRPVLITQAPRFVDKYEALTKAGQSDGMSFVVGADAWNATIAAHQYPSDVWLSEKMPHASFQIMDRPGIEVQQNTVSSHVPHCMMVTREMHCSSTNVRDSADPAGHEDLTVEVSEYVRNHSLYSNDQA